MYLVKNLKRELSRAFVAAQKMTTLVPGVGTEMHAGPVGLLILWMA